jgi:hypothetical protein
MNEKYLRLQKNRLHSRIDVVLIAFCRFLIKCVVEVLGRKLLLKCMLRLSVQYTLR